MTTPSRSSPESTTAAIGRSRWVGLGALVALLGGAAAGLSLRGVQAPWAGRTIGALELITGIWVDLLMLIVVPVVATHLYMAVRKLRGSRGIGGLGLRTVAVLVLVLVIGNVLALSGAYLAFSNYLPELTLSGQTSQEPVGGEADAVASLPARAFDAITSPNALLAAIFGSIGVGLLVRLLPERMEMVLDGVCRRCARMADAAFGVLLLAAPLAAFTLSLTFSARQGLDVAGALGWYLVVLCTVLVLMTLLLYPLVALSTDIGSWAWARALLPAQVLALTTRSSLATVPALLEAGRELGILETVREFVVPFAAATCKASTAISGPTTLVFLAMVFEIELSIAQVSGFLVGNAVISLADVGVPRVMPQMKTLPLYLAVGIPFEGYLLARVAAVLSDVFKTLTNTTGYLASAALVGAWQSSSALSVPAPEGTAE